MTEVIFNPADYDGVGSSGIVGIPGFGKSTLMYELARFARAHYGRNLILHNVADSPDDLPDDIENVPVWEDVLDACMSTPDVLLLIDEAHLYMQPRRYSRFLFKIAHTGRHLGWGLLWATQFPYDVDVVFRDLAWQLFVFKLGQKGNRWLQGYDWMNLNATKIKRFFYHAFNVQQGVYLGEGSTNI